MDDKIYSSKKQHLIFLGFELIAASLILIFLVNFKIQSVENIAHYNYVSILLLVFGGAVLLIGNRKRFFIFSTDSVKFINYKTEKFNICYKDIYLIRFFRVGNSKQIVLAILDENSNDLFQLSSAFFDGKVFQLVLDEFVALSKQYEFLIEDEVGWMEIPAPEKNEQ
ncbi:MAG: hypothetical protein ACPL1A_07825 [Candidatus Kapaibacteriota bacterium]